MNKAQTEHTRKEVTIRAAEMPERAVKLGFVNLGDDIIPEPGKEYDIVSASSAAVAALPYPKTSYRRLDLDIYSLFVDDLPDWGANEGLLKVSVDTKNPQDLVATSATASFVTQFVAKDGTYAPSFLYRGIFRNVVLGEWVNLRFQLYELDTDVRDYYKRVKAVIDGVPELKNLDVLQGIPYLSLATKLFDSIIMQFGVNPDDVIWSEIPILQVVPTPGGAFLRRGIYVLIEATNSAKKAIEFRDFRYKDERIVPKTSVAPSNHLTFGISVTEHT